MPTMPITITTDAERHAQALLGAVLEGWASDCLRLRATGLDRPSRRQPSAGVGPALRPRRVGTALAVPSASPRWAA
ncbi:MAG: hypothetical protein R3B49_08440 [Phycisphaerales bacterium]